MKCIMLINVKMPTIVGILIFISMVNTTFESIERTKFFAFQQFSFYKQLSEVVFNIGPDLNSVRRFL